MSEAGARVARVSIRVRYAETDRMGVAWHGNFLQWLEVGRTELMREAGCPYGELEEGRNVYFPVIDAHVRYLSPARYDDEVTVETSVLAVGGARVRFGYRLLRGGGDQLLATGHTEHASVDEAGRPIRMPADLRERLHEWERQA